jgi:Tol biopolymer transport system component
MDLSGNGQTRLGTDVMSRSPWAPYLTGDGRSITYTTASGGHVRMDVASGAATPLFGGAAGQPLPALPPGFHDPSLSADGQTVLAHYTDSGVRAERIAVLPLTDPGQVRLFPDAFASAQLSPDARSLIFIDNRRGTGNLWRQAIAGGMPVQLTQFDGEQIFRFVFTADGKQLALSRGSTISDVVLMTSRED